MPSDETRNSVKDKFAERFDNEKETEEPDEKRDNETSEDTSVEIERSVNVREDWQNHSVYLDADLSSELSSAYKKLDWQLDDEHDLSIKKTRHYYPLIVKLGLEQLDEMSTKETKEKLEKLETKDA